MAALATAPHVDAVVGLWALGTLLQSWLGAATVAPAVPATVTREVAGWTTTGRLSIWARGQFALRDGSGRLTEWIGQTLRAGAGQLAAAPAVRVRPVPLPGERPRPRVSPSAPLPLAA